MSQLQPLFTLGAGIPLDPIPLGAGAGALTFLFTLIYVMLKYVNSQGGSWQVLVGELQADIKAERAAHATTRAELTEERATNRVLLQKIPGQSP